jgi:flavin reductase (DIM6/NTAB) family NADH-FMN oxidoreductase RutF
MQFDFERMAALERYRLLLATVLPRPIAWVTTCDAAGAINAAPFSFFNVFGSDPATVGIGIGSKGPAEPKDTRANIRTNEQFVVNLVPFALAQEMRVTSIAFPKGVEEPKQAGLSLEPSLRVAVPRIARAPVSMECIFMQEIALGSFSLVLGKILMMHVKDEAVTNAARQHVDAEKLDLIAAWKAAGTRARASVSKCRRSRSMIGRQGPGRVVDEGLRRACAACGPHGAAVGRYRRLLQRREKVADHRDRVEAQASDFATIC